MAGGAALLGVLDSRDSVEFENKTSEARSYRNRIETDANDETAKRKLQVLIDGLPPLKLAKSHKSILGKLGSFFTAFGIAAFRLLHVKFWVLWAGSVGLLLLTFLPDTTGWPSFRFGAAKEAAWSVLNSDFSTAFAGVWLAALYFWLLQNQRRREAAHNLAIATDEAGRIRIRQETKVREDALEDYLEAYQGVADLLPFNIPFSSASAVDDQTAEDFEQVQLALVDAARGVQRFASTPVSDLVQEWRRLRSLIPGMRDRRNFAKFVERVLYAGRFKQHHAEWDSLYKALVARPRSDWSEPLGSHVLSESPGFS